MARRAPKVLARQPLGPSLAIAVRVTRDAQRDRRLAATRKALRSPALCLAVLALARGPRTPTELVNAMGKSKHVVSQQLATLRAVEIVHEAPALADDQRFRRYAVNWRRFGMIFAQDHATALELHATAQVYARADLAQGTLAPPELRLLSSGRLLLIRRFIPATFDALVTDPPPSKQRIQEEFEAAFRLFLEARSHTTLRDHLQAFYDEAGRYADLMPAASALGDFMRFQKASFQRAAPISDIVEAALTQLGPAAEVPTKRAAPPAATPILMFVEAGEEDASGNYVLQAKARELVHAGITLRIEPSFVYDPPGATSWT